MKNENNGTILMKSFPELYSIAGALSALFLPPTLPNRKQCKTRGGTGNKRLVFPTHKKRFSSLVHVASHRNSVVAIGLY